MPGLLENVDLLYTLLSAVHKLMTSSGALDKQNRMPDISLVNIFGLAGMFQPPWRMYK
jgi:hypothetical protein